jgi:polysaccharide chain length determinant protein (PEP-CTERM system associated)
VTSAKQSDGPEALLRFARRRLWPILVPAIVIAAAASWWIHRLPDRYRADALLSFVPQRVPESFVRSTVASRGDDRLQSITQQILSRTQLEQIIADFNLYAGTREAAAMQDVVDTMRTRDIEIRLVKGDVFRLGYLGDSPDIAMWVVNRLAALFIGQSSIDRKVIAEGTDRFLETQLEDARRKLVENEAKLEAYRRRHNGELPAQLDANVQGVHNTEMQMQVLVDSLNRDRDRQLVLERSLKDANLAAFVEGGAPARPRPEPTDSAKLTAAEQLERAQAALEQMQATMTAQHPDIITLKQRIVELRTRADAEAARHADTARPSPAETLHRTRVEDLRTELSMVERQIAQKTTDIERLRRVLLDYQRRIEAEPTRESELAALTRDYDTLQQTYRALLAKKQESEIAANLERQQIGAQFKVVDPAHLPERPFSPNRPRLYAIAVLGGLGAGLFLALLLEWFDRGLRSEDDVRAALGLPVLATIPAVSGGRGAR